MKKVCKKENCMNKVVGNENYCPYHQSRREDIKKSILNGAVALATIAISIVLKRKPK